MHNIFTWNKTLLIKRLCVMFVEGTIKREKENQLPASNCKFVELYSYTTFTQSLDSQTDRIIEKENDVRFIYLMTQKRPPQKCNNTTLKTLNVQAHFTIIQSMYPFEGFTYQALSNMASYFIQTVNPFSSRLAGEANIETLLKQQFLLLFQQFLLLGQHWLFQMINFLCLL